MTARAGHVKPIAEPLGQLFESWQVGMRPTDQERSLLGERFQQRPRLQRIEFDDSVEPPRESQTSGLVR
jgi:hypothetical protein